MNKFDYLQLGASLYVPAVRDDLIAVASGKKLGHVRSLIFCTEDSVAQERLEEALGNLREMLRVVQCQPRRRLFVRPRNEQVLTRLLQMPGIEQVSGFVLPKVTAANMPAYLNAFKEAGKDVRKFWLMPTLETAEVFEPEQMRALRNVLLQSEAAASVVALRIGGNDLLNVLGLRRSRTRTLYESALSQTVTQLLTIFRPAGFQLSSPVCELLYDHDVLQRELAMDTELGLFAKTAIHPDQVAIIEAAYRPLEQEVQMAEAILAPGAPAVFNMHGTMCEVATHREWATQVLIRRDLYGVYGKELPAASPACSATTAVRPVAQREA